MWEQQTYLQNVRFLRFYYATLNKRQIMQNPGTFIRKPRCCGKFDGEKPRRLNL